MHPIEIHRFNIISLIVSAIELDPSERRWTSNNAIRQICQFSIYFEM